MARGVLKVTPEQMQSAAAELRGYVNTMEQSFRDMKQTMAASTHYWVGKSGDAHRALYNEQVADAEEFIARCREHIRDLYAMAGVYIEAEQTATAKAEELPTITF